MSSVAISRAAAAHESAKSRSSTFKLALNWIICRLPIFTPLIRYILHQSQFLLMSWYRSSADMKLLRTIYRERRPLLQPLESFHILALAGAQSQLDGDMAEVGVCQGSSARMICTEKGNHHFRGFDTFSGLADVGAQDTHNGVRFFRAGHFAADYETTSAYLKEFDNVQLVKGFFPESAECIADRKFSFVHPDVDTYGSTLASMRYFWPRPGDRGIIITHGAHSDGVARAIAEFTAETGARAISSACSQMILTR